MNVRLHTKAELEELRALPKRVTNPRARWSDKPKARPAHGQCNFQAVGQQDEAARFLIHQRRNLADENDFSCGITYLARGGPPLTLARYNGPDHEHGAIAYRPHIHRATEEAIAAGGKPEREAEETERYETLEGALACLIDDFNLSGLTARHDQPGLRL